MRSIRFVQWGGAILAFLTVLFLLVNGVLIMYFKTRATMDDLVKLAGILLLFVGPEVLAGFFGPVLKRKQQNGNQKDPSTFLG